MTKRQAKQGKRGEQIARGELEKLGVENLEFIGTHFTIVDMRSIGGRAYYYGFFGEKVAADWRGEMPSGISVMAEAKTTSNKDTLRWSAFRSHQPAKLSAHNGITLVVWVCETDWTQDIYVMLWSDMLEAGFAPRHSIDRSTAAKLAQKCTEKMENWR